MKARIIYEWLYCHIELVETKELVIQKNETEIFVYIQRRHTHTRPIAQQRHLFSMNRIRFAQTDEMCIFFYYNRKQIFRFLPSPNGYGNMYQIGGTKRVYDRFVHAICKRAPLRIDVQLCLCTKRMHIGFTCLFVCCTLAVCVCAHCVTDGFHRALINWLVRFNKPRFIFGIN